MGEERTELERVPPPDEAAFARLNDVRGGYYPNDYGYRYGDEYEQDAPSTALNDLWRAIRKHKFLVIFLTVACTAFVTLETLRYRSIYSASAMVEIRRDAPLMITSNEDSDPENSVSINTKMLVFNSRPFLEDVVTKLRLNRNEKFIDVSQKRSWWETLKSLGGALQSNAEDAAGSQELRRQPRATVTHAGETPADARPPAYETAAQQGGEFAALFVEDPELDCFVAVLERGLSIGRVKDTQALKISFTHTDPTMAAVVANGIALNFAQRNFESKTEKFTNTSGWLERSTRELEGKVKQAEQEMANYNRDHGIYSTQGQQTLTSDKLVRLHDQAMRAEMDVLLKRSLYEEVRQGRVEQLPEAFSDTKISDLQKKLNDLSVSVAQLSVSYGPENPRVTEVQQQMVKLQEQIDAGRKRLEEKIKADYERSARDEQSLRAALDHAKSEAVQQDQTAIQYNILKQNLDTAKLLYTEFLQKTNQAKLQVAEQHNNVNIIQPARIPRSPDGPGRGLAIILGGIFSLAGGVGLAFLIEYFDKSIKNVADVTRFAQLPTLGVIPSVDTKKYRGIAGRSMSDEEVARTSIAGDASADVAYSETGPFLYRFFPSLDSGRKRTGSNSAGAKQWHLTMLDQWSSVAEAYRALRTSMLLSPAGSPPRTVLFTSGLPGEGKTTTVINTAISLAQLGASVLVIDADLRKPTTHKGFGVERAQGLSTLLSRNAEIDSAIQKLPIPNLSLLPCGPIPPNPAELISSEKMKELIATLSGRYNHILIDSPPLMYVTDPLVLSTLVDGVILVVHGGKSTRGVVRQSREMLTNIGAKLSGVVLNNVNLRYQSYSDFAYHSYYQDYGRKGDGRASNILSR
jgi:succinoglycan biosynthesis transport protein ExoP